MTRATAMFWMLCCLGCVELRPYREAMFFAPGAKERLGAAKTMQVRLSSSYKETESVTQDEVSQARVNGWPGGGAVATVTGSSTYHRVGGSAEADLLRGRVEECMARLGNQTVRSSPADVVVELNLVALRLGAGHFAGWVTDRIRLEWLDGQTGELLASQEGRGTVAPFPAELTIDWMLAAYCH